MLKQSEKYGLTWITTSFRVNQNITPAPRAELNHRDQEEPMHRVPRCWSALAALVVIFSLVVPGLATSVKAQDDGNVLRVHHLSYPDVVDPQKSSTTPEIDIL